MALGDRDRFERMSEDIHEIRKNTEKPSDPGPGCSEALGCNPGCLLLLLIVAGLIVWFVEFFIVM